MRFIRIALLSLLFSSCIITDDTQRAGSPFVFERIPLQGDMPALTDFRFLPDSSDFLAVTRAGKVGYFKMGENRAALVDSFEIPGVHLEADCGAAGIEIDPDFSENGFFYVSYCVSTQMSTVTRYVFHPDAFRVGGETAAEIITAGDPLATRSIHGITGMHFDSEKAMLVSVGEKGRGENAQDLNNSLGKIIRIIPNRDPSGTGYSLPGDNPFAGGDPADDAVYAFGLRNPWRASFDSQGRYWIADVGSVKHEEINVVSGEKRNFGWPLAEGPCATPACSDFADPVVSYPHGADNRFAAADPAADRKVKFRVAWVGAEYDPSGGDRYRGLLDGKMLYGEWYQGWIRGIRLGPNREILADDSVGHLPFVVSVQQASDKYLYAASMFSDIAVDENGNPIIVDPAQVNGTLWRLVLRDEKEGNIL